LIKRHASIIPAAIVSVALLVRLWFALTCSAIPDFSDMAFYNEVALRPGFPVDLPPGYPLFLRGIYAIFGAHNYRAVFVIQALLSTLTVFMIYRVGRAVSDERAGLIAAAIAAVYPNFIIYNLTTLTETVSVFVIVALLGTIVSGVREGVKPIAAAALLLAGCLFRPALLFFAPGALLALRKRLLFAVAVAAVAIPVLLFGSTFGGIVQRGSLCLYKAYNPSATGAGYVDPANTELGRDDLPSATYLRAAFEFVRSHTWQAVDLVYAKASLLLSSGWDMAVMRPIVGPGRNRAHILAYAAVPIMVLGLAGMIVHHRERTKALTFLALSYLAVIILFSIFKLRYRLLVEPIAIVYTGILLRHGFVRRSGSEDPRPAAEAFTRRAAWALALVCVAGLALRVYPAIAGDSTFLTPRVMQASRAAVESDLGSDTPPLYPLFLKGVAALTGGIDFRAVFVLQGILGACAALLLYAAVARLAGLRAGLIAAALAAVYPPLVLYGLAPTPEPLVVVVVCAIMAVAASRLSDGRKAAVLGALAAAGVLLKPALVCLAPGMLLATARRRLCLLVLMLALVPFTAINLARSGKIEPVYTAGVFPLGFIPWVNPQDAWSVVDAIYSNAAAAFGRGFNIDPHLGPGGGTGSGARHLAVYGYQVVMLAGFVGLLRRYRSEHRAIVMTLGLYVAALVLLSRFGLDCRVPLEPLFIAYIAILLGEESRSSVLGEK
jgi:4-amino-4-deoxy-L-arabinose transferase-like glycosyltransferase